MSITELSTSSEIRSHDAPINKLRLSREPERPKRREMRKKKQKSLFDNLCYTG